MPQRILYVSSRGNTGAGGENYLLTLFRNIDRTRFNPVVILPKEGSLRAPLEALDIQVLVVEADYGWLKPDEPWYNTLEGMQSRVKAIVDVIAQYNIELVHTNSNHRLEGAMAARLAGIPHLYLAHIEFQPDMPIFQRFPMANLSYAQLMSDLSDQVVAVSHSVASRLAAHVPAQQLEVIHNGLELEIFDKALAQDRQKLRAGLGVDQDTVLVSAVGRIAPDKGFDILLDAAHAVLKHTTVKIIFAISGAEENAAYVEQLNSTITKYGVGEQIRFLGFRADVPDILAASDIFVLSSRKEGHPYVMLEAMAAKCAVVASKCAGVEDTIEEGVSGFIFNIGDLDTLVRRLIEIIDSPALRDALSTAARQRVERKFTADKTANSLMKVYDKAINMPLKKTGSPSIEFFLQICKEIGYLGKKSIEQETRLKKLENAMDVIIDNPLSRTVRKLRGLMQ